MITVSSSSGTSSTPAPAGTHYARCYQIVDLGTHEKVFPGKAPRLAREIRVSWELPDEKHAFSEEKGEQPFSVHKTYTLSLHEKSNLRHDLESWRGRQFTDEELKKFDLVAILSAACLVTVTHVEKQGKRYANVVSVAAVPKGMAKLAQINPSLEYSLEHHDQATFDKLPGFLQDIVKTSMEWKELSETTKQEPLNDTPDLDDSDSIPF